MLYLYYITKYNFNKEKIKEKIKKKKLKTRQVNFDLCLNMFLKYWMANKDFYFIGTLLERTNYSVA